MAAGLTMAGATESRGATLPAGFAETKLAGGMNNVTAMAIAPDGRVFVSEQGGRLLVIKDAATPPIVALTLTVDSTNERGLLGTAFDPAFPSQPYIYVYYTAPNPSPDPGIPNLGAFNRISRFTVSGDAVVAGSESILVQLPPLGTAPIHNAGALHFAPDGTLFVSVGDNFNAPNSQNVNSPMGKLLRFKKDGTIPPDNPFVGQAGHHPAVWALGLRNPYTFAIQRGTGRIFVNDVGDKLYDEINDIVKGGNYGWADTEGPHDDPRYLQPFYSRPWSSADCTLIGAAFYNPTTATFPSKYVGKFFYSDLCGGYINVLDPATGDVFETFVPAGGLRSPVDLDVADDGSLYYLARGQGQGTGELFRITASNGAPHISVPPAGQKVTIGEPATFTCAANGFDPLRFSWLRNGVIVQGPAVEPHGTSTYSFVVSAADDGARIACKVENDLGAETSADAILTATTNQTPNPVILTPPDGATYRGGDTISFSGDAFDAEDGTLPASAFTWEVVFDHDSHTHPGIVVTGQKAGTYLVPNVGETSANVKYRLILRVTDSAGLTRVVERNIRPHVTQITIASDPSGREVKLDAQPKTAPITVDAVSGMTRQLDLEAWQHLSEGGPTSAASTIWYEFLNWSDGGAKAHTITVPETPATYTARFQTLDNPECIPFPTLSRFLNMPFPNQVERFSIEFDATPIATTSAVVNANIGLSDGPRGGLPGQAAMIIFNTAGRIQARGFTGGEPPNTQPAPPAPPVTLAPTYQVNTTYHFRLEIDVTNHTYDAYYTAPGQPEQLLKAGLRFRVEHQFLTQLNNWGVFVTRIAADPSATVRVCRFSVNCSNSKNTPPVVTAPPDIVVRTGSSASACHKVVSDAQLGTATATDNCKFGLGAVQRSGVPAGNVFPVGTTIVTYSATDGAGLVGTATQRVTVVDDTRPKITNASVSPKVLWPPNGQFVTVNVNYTTTDNCSVARKVLSVRSSQPVGSTSPDWIVLDSRRVKLRAERTGNPLRKRIYTITIDSIDPAGNVASKELEVEVPKHR